jgi:hypothetical protein
MNVHDRRRAKIWLCTVRVSLSPIEVGELMRAWIENVYSSRLTPALAQKLHESWRPVRALLAQRNRNASEAMWADDYLRAREILLASGLPDFLPSNVSEPRRAVRQNQKAMQAQTLTRAVLKSESQQHSGSHWQTVK